MMNAHLRVDGARSAAIDHLIQWSHTTFTDSPHTIAEQFLVIGNASTHNVQTVHFAHYGSVL